MNITILNWNIGGAKVLELTNEESRIDYKKKINNHLLELLQDKKPDIVTLQEVVAYKQPSDKCVINIIEQEQLKNFGYKCFYFPLIDSLGFSSQSKWKKISKDSDWNPNTYFAQGNAMLFRENAPLFPFWDLSRPGELSPGKRLLTIYEQQKTNPVQDLIREFDANFQNYLIEHVHLEGGVYFGDRDTEPRAALIAHLIFHSPNPEDQKPIDVFIVNVHLITITKERVGIPADDAYASKLRIKQLNDIFDGIVSRYNSWFNDGFPQRGKIIEPDAWETYERHQPVWILCGDFNFTENSVEYNHIMRRNFIDTTPVTKRTNTILEPNGDRVVHKGTKAKGAGNPATLTLDYIFAGPKFIALDPLFSEEGMLSAGNNVVEHKINSSDHYPVISELPLLMVQ